MKITLIRKEETVVAQRTVKLETVLENMKTETKTCPVSALRRTLKFSGGSGHVTAVDKLPRILFSVELGKSKEISVIYMKSCFNERKIIPVLFWRLKGPDRSEKPIY